MTGSHDSPSGWFYQTGWWVDGAGAYPEADVLVSVHEHYHHQLQNATSFGALTYLLGRIAALTVDRGRQEASDRFTDACRLTHEAFATWASVMATGHGGASLDERPDYRAHFEALDSLLAGVEGAYLRFHLAQAIARACMQSNAGEVALDRGLLLLELADVRIVDRPDHRLRLLRRARLDPRPAVARALDGRTAGELAWMRAPELAAWMFDPSEADLFRAVNTIFFDEVAAALERLDCRTLATDGHLALTGALIADAERVAGRTIGIEAIGARDTGGRSWEVMRTCEGEQVRLPGVSLEARLVDPSVGVDAMVAGLGNDAHLFVVLRKARDVHAGYAWAGGAPACAGFGVWLRRSVMEDERRVVEWMDVSTLGPDAVEDAGVEVQYSVAESALRSDEAQQWRSHLKVRKTTLLADTRLADRLRYWLAAGGTFRCCFLSATSFGRGVPVMIGRFEMDGNAAHVLVRPLTSAAVGCYRGVFAEVDPARRHLVEDPELVRDQQRLISFAMAHLIGEEQVFRVEDG